MVDKTKTLDNDSTKTMIIGVPPAASTDGKPSDPLKSPKPESDAAKKRQERLDRMKELDPNKYPLY